MDAQRQTGQLDGPAAGEYTITASHGVPCRCRDHAAALVMRSAGNRPAPRGPGG